MRDCLPFVSTILFEPLLLAPLLSFSSLPLESYARQSRRTRSFTGNLQLHSPIVSVKRAHIREKFAISANYARMVDN